MLKARSAFAGMPVALPGSAGVEVIDRDGLGIATVLVRRGQAAALAQRVHERFGIDLPSAARRVVAGDIAFACTGPGAWLATCEDGANAFCGQVKEAIGESASVSDQSDGYAVLRLSGPRVREALAKVIPLDLHSRVFEAGHVASTVASHIGVTLWRLDDGADKAPVFEIVASRSFAGSLWHSIFGHPDGS